MMHWLLNLIESYLFSTDEMTVDEFKESVNEANKFSPKKVNIAFMF